MRHRKNCGRAKRSEARDFYLKKNSISNIYLQNTMNSFYFDKNKHYIKKKGASGKGRNEGRRGKKRKSTIASCFIVQIMNVTLQDK